MPFPGLWGSLSVFPLGWVLRNLHSFLPPTVLKPAPPFSSPFSPQQWALVCSLLPPPHTHQAWPRAVPPLPWWHDHMFLWLKKPQGMDKTTSSTVLQPCAEFNHPAWAQLLPAHQPFSSCCSGPEPALGREYKPPWFVGVQGRRLEHMGTSQAVCDFWRRGECTC